MNRRAFLAAAAGAAGLAPLIDIVARAAQDVPGFRLVDVTGASGLRFVHNTGAYGEKLPSASGHAERWRSRRRFRRRRG